MQGLFCYEQIIEIGSVNAQLRLSWQYRLIEREERLMPALEKAISLEQIASEF